MTTMDKATPSRSAQMVAARLTDAIVIELRERYAAGETQPVLAADYGLSIGHVSKIVTGLRWCHTGGPITRAGQRRGA